MAGKGAHRAFRGCEGIGAGLEIREKPIKRPCDIDEK